jgi:hypothetical protein
MNSHMSPADLRRKHRANQFHQNRTVSWQISDASFKQKTLDLPQR